MLDLRVRVALFQIINYIFIFIFTRCVCVYLDFALFAFDCYEYERSLVFTRFLHFAVDVMHQGTTNRTRCPDTFNENRFNVNANATNIKTNGRLRNENENIFIVGINRNYLMREKKSVRRM